MPTKIVYADIQSYLQAIADNPNDSGDIDSAGHKRFWNIPYADFIAKSVPGEDCNGQPISIVGKLPTSPNVDPSVCPFYQALVNPKGWCNKGQMPKFGPASALITDPRYTVSVKKPDGSTVNMNGQDIMNNIESWLKSGLPEK
jgi:hypothetical protein